MNEKPEHEVDEEIANLLKNLASVVSGESDTCLHCGAKFEKLEQVGRCVYARPCGCKQYQGKVPKAKS